MITRIDSSNSNISKIDISRQRYVVIKENSQFVISSNDTSFATRRNNVEVFPVEKFIYSETPSPVVDGAQTLFTLDNPYIAGTLVITRGTLRMHPTADYTETSPNAGTFTMAVAPESSEPLIVDYIKQ